MLRRLRLCSTLLFCAAILLGFADSAYADGSDGSNATTHVSGSADDGSDTHAADDGSDDSSASPRHWRDRPIPFEPMSFDGDAFVRVDRLRAPVFARTSTHAGRGFVRQGVVLPATLAGRTDSCPGTWWEVGSGYICSAIGYEVRSSRPESLAESVAPRLDRGLPYRYAMVTDRESFRLETLPTERELERLRSGAYLPGLGSQLDGDFFVAFARDGEDGSDGPVLQEHDAPGGPYLRTIDGRYVSADAIDFVEASALVGQYNAGGLDLPLAFVVEATQSDGGHHLNRYVRFGIDGIDDDHALMAHGRVPRSALRLARLHPRPAEVGQSEKWIHIDLDEQILVAYEGDRPVFATLVASGKAGYDTPDGLFRIRHKHITTTMRGDDPIDGVYDVAEVPWTMYYDGSYALHGAYWHDAFGNVRSHGCTNIAPGDARFLFGWSTPVVPERWHAVREDGTWVLLTREGEVDEAAIEHQHGDPS